MTLVHGNGLSARMGLSARRFAQISKGAAGSSHVWSIAMNVRTRPVAVLRFGTGGAAYNSVGCRAEAVIRPIPET